MSERLAVASRAGDRRIDHAEKLQPKRPRRTAGGEVACPLVDHGAAQRLVAQDAALPTEPRGASNCGLINATRSAPGAKQPTTAGTTSLREMKDTSTVIKPI